METDGNGWKPMETDGNGWKRMEMRTFGPEVIFRQVPRYPKIVSKGWGVTSSEWTRGDDWKGSFLHVPPSERSSPVDHPGHLEESKHP